MIESLHSLGRNPLPAITTLNLRSNRLISLAGIERIPTLERVDVRDNKLTDPTEIARLTGVPDSITEVYVHRNPFCKSYPNYRLTIFNLFRKTPGYTEDIVIDSTGPSNSERKQLVDRAPELPSAPIMKPPPEDEAPPPKVPPKIISVSSVDNATGASITPKRTNSHQRSKSALTGSQKRKKAPKRRVVELSRNEAAQEDLFSPSINPFDRISASAEAPNNSNPAADIASESVPHFEEPRAKNSSGDPAKKSTSQPAQSPPVAPQQLPPIDTTIKPQPTNPPEFDVSSDLYKKKIEALRQDFGNTWLSALGDENWDANSVASFADRGYTSPAIRPTLPRTPSQGIVSGGRTLG
jgi:hypothetical protein